MLAVLPRSSLLKAANVDRYKAVSRAVESALTAGVFSHAENRERDSMRELRSGYAYDFLTARLNGDVSMKQDNIRRVSLLNACKAESIRNGKRGFMSFTGQPSISAVNNCGIGIVAVNPFQESLLLSV